MLGRIEPNGLLTRKSIKLGRTTAPETRPLSVFKNSLLAVIQKLQSTWPEYKIGNNNHGNDSNDIKAGQAGDTSLGSHCTSLNATSPILKSSLSTRPNGG